MSAASRKLGVGAKVFTDFSGRITIHTITEVQRMKSTSGIGFIVNPTVPKSTGGLICADWFEPAEATTPAGAAKGGDTNSREPK